MRNNYSSIVLSSLYRHQAPLQQSLNHAVFLTALWSRYYCPLAIWLRKLDFPKVTKLPVGNLECEHSNPSSKPKFLTPWCSVVKKTCPSIQEMQARFPGWEDPLEKEMAIHTSILAWRIPWTEEPSGLQSIGWHRAGLNWHDLACMHILIPYENIWNICFLCRLLRLKTGKQAQNIITWSLLSFVINDQWRVL